MKRIGLCLLLHDPIGRYAPFMATHLAGIVANYTWVVVCATPKTSAETLTQLQQHAIPYTLDATVDIGESRRRTLALGLAQEPAATHLHYCDADRMLHWQMHHPAELTRLVADLQALEGYAAIGRTTRAFNSHPPVQISAETITNRVYSWVVGEQTAVHDVTAGSSAMTRLAAEVLLRHSVEPSNATDCEWPSIILRHTAMPVVYLRTEGLEFETQTFTDEDVLLKMNSAEIWSARMKLAEDSYEAAMRVMKQ